MKKKALIFFLAVLSLSIVLSACSTSTSNSTTATKKKNQEYPTKQIEVTVPFAPGGGTDLIARAMSDYLSKEWGQPVIVVNKPGAGGATGTQEVLNGKKDGYSVLVQPVSAVSTLFAGNKNLPFKPEDLHLISRTTEDPLAFVVKADAPWKDLKEFNEWVKENPDQLSYSGNGATSIAALGVIQWMDSFGADFSKTKLIVVKGSNDGLQKVAGGHITLAVQGVSEVTNLVNAGKLKILGIASPKRSPYFPDVPTMEEQGVKGIDVSAWFGVSTPTGTPDYVVNKWESTIEQMLKDPVFQEKLKSMNATASYMNSADFTKHVNEEIVRFTEIAEKHGLVK